MPAPLHSKFKRLCERDSRPYTPPGTRSAFLMWKHRALVYALSEEASYAAGKFSIEPPDVLLAHLRQFEWPADRLWVEFDWKALTKGSAIEYFPEEDPHANERPVRSACLMSRYTDKGDEQWHSYFYHLYPGGKTYILPIRAAYGNLNDPAPKQDLYAPPGKTLSGRLIERAHLAGVGLAYHVIHRDHPGMTTLVEWCQHGMLLPAVKSDTVNTLITETHGTARNTIAMMAAISTARRRTYIQSGETVEIPREPRASDYHRVHEVNLFLTPKVTVSRQVITGAPIARKKAGRHHVVGHYCYRQRRDGSDPAVCPTGLGGHHDFERVEEGKPTEVCVLCGQKRWYRAQFERGQGEEIPAPVYNIHG